MQPESVDRTNKIFDYLDDIVRLGHKVVHRLEDHNNFLLYQNKLPVTENVKANDLFYQLQSSLLEIKRCDLPERPEIPKNLNNWIKFSSALDSEPEIIFKRKMFNNQKQECFYDIPERPLIFKEYKEKLETWIKEVEPLKKSRELFDELFSVSKTLRYEENLELILGYGILHWKKDNKLIKYPLLTQKAIIEHEAKKDKIIVKTPDDAMWDLELESLIDVGISDLGDIRDKFDEIKYNYDFEEGNPYLNLFYEATGITPDGKLIKDIEDASLKPNENLRIVNGWTLFVRKRNQNELIEDIRAFNEQLKENNITLPNSLQSLVEDPDETTVNWDKSEFHDEWTGLLDNDILFPKEANEEQIQILDCLQKSNGVIVQGPPGTGKSHTIANLISHFMAHGQRVLVTSQKDQALKVLRDMIPESLKSLCISVLQNDVNRKQKLEKAVSYISEIVSKEDYSKLKEKANDLEEKFVTLKKRLQKISTKLKRLAEAELPIITDNMKYSLSPAEVAKKIEQEDKYQWFTDHPSYKTTRAIIDNEDVIKLEDEFPLTDDEFEELKVLRQNLLPKLDELSTYQLPDTDNLLTPEEFKDMAQNLEKIYQLEQKADDYFPNLVLKEDVQKNTIDLIEKGIKVYNVIEASWAKRLIDDASEFKEQLNDALDTLGTIYENINKLHKSIGLITSIELDENVSLDKYKEFVDSALERVNQAKKPWKWFSLFDGGEKKALQEIRFNGQQPNNQEEWEKVKDYIKLKLKVNKFVQFWSGLKDNFASYLPDLSQQADFQQVEKVYQKLESAFNYKYELRLKLKNELSKVIIGEDKVLEERLEEELENIYQALKIKLEQREFIEAEQIFTDLKENLAVLQQRNAHPIVDELIDCLPDEIHVVKEKVAKWKNNYEQLKEIEEFLPDYNKFKELVDKLSTQASNWAEQWMNPEYTLEDLNISVWEEAWEEAILESYLEDISNKEDKISKLEAEQDKFQQQIKKAKENLVLTKTKLRLKDSITDSDLMSLNKWKKAVKRYGKGTGKYAPKWRREMQKHMQEAKDAIPAWIMPIYRVSETIPKEFGCFDVLIIDEASQCDIRSLLALCRAEKVIIVGDDQQISPSAVGVPHDKVDAFIKQHLDDLPHNTMMDLKTSLYDIGEIIFNAQSRLMLKEHFRCVPEIIEFSNRLCYNNEILPLRNVPDSEKLKPTLESNFVAEGYINDRGKINKPEAEAICKKVKELAEDPRYKDKTFGVISLKGKKQAKYIFDEIDNYLTSQQLAEHDFLAGDAYTFQGDERDVIILSLVVANNRRFRALTKESAQQRFNVAVSRAKDQLILFHSVELGADLNNKEDMRYKLLNYIQNGSIEREELENPKELCDSVFEKDVYDWLTERGYKVTPQVEVGNYRIDLVVEGRKNRLAVECDGDRWHPPEKWWEDRMRQRQLERVGWTFWRVSGTTFYSNPDEAMQSIIPRLKELNIEPLLKKEKEQINKLEKNLNQKDEVANNFTPDDVVEGPHGNRGKIIAVESDNLLVEVGPNKKEKWKMQNCSFIKQDKVTC
ncbi:AAA domain-containing protein [Acetohalobium arabaticum]|uniref:DNA helicase n=1 Tax=Acetohalobium arabaticum (strain ATCC 49924 / DSM 5501 / Z-7288) TaxID=574087 RepID=D9QPQ9_ACEAZ|nr:AAA domain-containing protein [Acetohalobium arabaticum]ADL12500.1 conserved hypothetical protein [Acetohalobium arabaticum DSM 5501]